MSAEWKYFNTQIGLPFNRIFSFFYGFLLTCILTINDSFRIALLSFFFSFSFFYVVFIIYFLL